MGAYFIPACLFSWGGKAGSGSIFVIAKNVRCDGPINSKCAVKILKCDESKIGLIIMYAFLECGIACSMHLINESVSLGESPGFPLTLGMSFGLEKCHS